LRIRRHDGGLGEAFRIFHGWFTAGVLVIALAWNAGSAQSALDRRATTEVEELSWFFMPPTSVLHVLATGYGHALADLLWMEAMWVLGDPDFGDEDYLVVTKMLDTITDLKPSFYYLYRLGGSYLGASPEGVGGATALLEKGTRAFPDDWFLPFLIGFNYFYYAGDNARAAPYLDRAASLPGAPSYLRGLAARIYAKADEKRAALALLSEVAGAEPDPERRAGYMARIEELQREIDRAEAYGPPEPDAAAASTDAAEVPNGEAGEMRP